jgi:vacuolar protein sorting-associated protein 52
VQVLTQLLLYYTRFQEIVKKAWAKKPPPFAKDLVATAVILVEIKKYSRSI